MATVLIVLSGHTGVSYAAPPPDPDLNTGTVRVSGDVSTVVTFTAHTMRALPHRTESVTFQTHAWPQNRSYQGCSLEDMITAAGPIGKGGARHPLLTVAVVATGADGYAATLSWGDVSAHLTSRPALVAWSEDGVMLGRPRLVVPDDLNGARYVADLTELAVVQLDRR